MTERRWERWTKQAHVDDFKQSWERSKPTVEEDLGNFLPTDHRSVLDVGCGFGAFHSLLTRNGAAYTGVDNSEVMLANFVGPTNNVILVSGDIFNLEEVDGQFEMVSCFNVLFHLPSVVRAIHNLWAKTTKYLVFNMRVGPLDFVVDSEGWFYLWLPEEEMKIVLGSLNPKPLSIRTVDVRPTSWFAFRTFLLTKSGA